MLGQGVGRHDLKGNTNHALHLTAALALRGRERRKAFGPAAMQRKYDHAISQSRRTPAQPSIAGGRTP